MASLPLQIAVEVEIVLEVSDTPALLA